MKHLLVILIFSYYHHVSSSALALDNKNNTDIRNKRIKRFTCPGDGKWPDPLDCGKFFNCQGSSSTGGWCGPGMAFDVDNQRCEMALAINCKDGDRPDWKAPDGWEGKTTTTTTKRTTFPKLRKTTTAPIDEEEEADTPVQKVADNVRVGDRCTSKGNIPDKENCAKYYYCKGNEIKQDICEDGQLFDEDSKKCKDFRSVYCNDRPVNEKSKDPCKHKPNGVYPNVENGCSEFYQCSAQRKVKSGECPIGLKFNVLTLRCDWPNNVVAPCGSKKNFTNRLKAKFTVIMVITFLIMGMNR